MADADPIRRDTWWIFPDGTRLPVISGGQDPTPPTPPATGDPTPTNPTPQAPPPAPTSGTQGDPPELGDAGKKALAEERRARRDAEAKLKDLQPLAAKAQELEEAQKTEAQKLGEKLQAATTDGANSKAELLRLQVALEKAPDGMPPAKVASLAGRLKGSTREELEADAKELFADFGPPATAGENNTEPGASPTAGQPGGQPRPDPAQGSRGAAPAGRPSSLGQAVGAHLARPKT